MLWSLDFLFILGAAAIDQFSEKRVAVFGQKLVLVYYGHLPHDMVLIT